MSTCTIGGVMMLNEQERPQRSRPPGEFRRYVLRQHPRWGNAQHGAGQVFTGVALHTTGAAGWENVPNPSTHFTRKFARYLDSAIRDMHREQDRHEHEWRFQRVEAALLRMEKEKPELATVIRHYQTPASLRERTAILAGEMGLTVDGLESRLTKALDVLLDWYLGGAW